jgi:ankyrin repeat protein
VARLLLDKGASAEAADNDGSTPLHLASQTGHEAVARLLLDKGASATAADKYAAAASAEADGRQGRGQNPALTYKSESAF